MSDVVIYEKKGRIAYIKLNRPEVMNAINTDVWHSLTEAWLQVRDDSEVWVAIVTGAGDKAFSAGADLKGLSARHEKSRKEGRVHESPMPLNNPMRGIQIWKPIIKIMQ